MSANSTPIRIRTGAGTTSTTLVIVLTSGEVRPRLGERRSALLACAICAERGDATRTAATGAGARREKAPTPAWSPRIAPRCAWGARRERRCERIEGAGRDDPLPCAEGVVGADAVVFGETGAVEPTGGAELAGAELAGAELAGAELAGAELAMGTELARVAEPETGTEPVAVAPGTALAGATWEDPPACWRSRLAAPRCAAGSALCPSWLPRPWSRLFVACCSRAPESSWAWVCPRRGSS